MTKDNIEELESHLQDEIYSLQKLGLTIEESMLIAKKRIGNIEELTTEFGKVNKVVYFKNSIIPYLKGILMFIAFITITDLLTSFSIIIANKTGVISENLNYVSIGTLILISFILLIALYKKYKDVSLDLGKLTSIPILVSVILASKLLTTLSLPIITHSMGISDFGALQLNLNIYKLLFGLFLLIVSCLVFYSLKRENKIKIAE